MHVNFNSVDLSLSGGNRFIFELSNSLVDRGYKVTITHVGLKYYHNWFSPIKAEIIDCGYSVPERAFLRLINKRPSMRDMEIRLSRNVPDCDVNVATYCMTAYSTVESRKGRMFYLVQNYEPWFFDDKSTQERASATYDMPLKKLCVSRWLTEKVNGEYIGNGVNLRRFKLLSSGQKSGYPFRVMAFLRNIPWKGDKLIVDAINVLKTKLPCVVVIPRKVTDEQLVRLYNESDVLLYASKFEGFGYSPLEAMACGLPVVTTKCLGIDEYAQDGINALVADDNPVSLASAIKAVLIDEKLKSKLVKAGLETAKQYDFEKVVDRFESCIGSS